MYFELLQRSLFYKAPMWDDSPSDFFGKNEDDSSDFFGDFFAAFFRAFFSLNGVFTTDVAECPLASFCVIVGDGVLFALSTLSRAAW